MRNLNLTLKKKWFDMIASGKKKEEYREIKPYWESRLVTPYLMKDGSCHPFYAALEKGDTKSVLFKVFDRVTFKNGYQKNARKMTFQCLGITKGTGNRDWGAPENEVFIIQLGRKTS